MKLNGSKLSINLFLIGFFTQDDTKIVCTIGSDKCLADDRTGTKIQTPSESSCHPMLMSHIMMETRKRKLNLAIEIELGFDDTVWSLSLCTDDHTIDDTLAHGERVCIHRRSFYSRRMLRDIDRYDFIISSISSG